MRLFHRLARATTIALLLVVAGCCSHGRHQLLCDECADIPPGAIPQGPGAYTGQWQAAQEQLAEQADYVVYQNEWLGESEKLSPLGVRHVAGLLGQGPFHPIVVQASGNQTLDEARRMALIAKLETHGIAGAPENVVVDNSTPEGLHGVEAPLLGRGYLRGSSRGGAGGFRSGGGSGGLQNGGGSFGGGGFF